MLTMIVIRFHIKLKPYFSFVFALTVHSFVTSLRTLETNTWNTEMDLGSSIHCTFWLATFPIPVVIS